MLAGGIPNYATRWQVDGTANVDEYLTVLDDISCGLMGARCSIMFLLRDSINNAAWPPASK